MAASSVHKGWTTHYRGILGAVYSGIMPGGVAVSANTAVDGVLIGTPVVTAIPVDSIVVSNQVASGDILVALNDGSGNSWEYARFDSSAGLVVFNEASSDIDFRVESNNMAFAIYVDGGKDALVIGSNTDTSVVDQLVTISRAARTATAATNYYDFIIAPAGAVTVPAGTTAIVATARFNEPNITATGTVTACTTVYIANAPTEAAANNYALWIDSGVLRLDGNLNLADAAVDIVVIAATAAALEISDGTTKFYAIDTRVATASVTTHTFNISAYTIASGATNVETALSVAAHTLNYTGTTQVTSAVNTVTLGARTIAGASAVTVDQGNTLRLAAPVEGTNVTLTAASAIRIADAGGTPTNQYGIFIESLTAGATADYAIWVAGANAVHLGTAGTATGLLEIDGATSGTMTLTVPAATTSYTLTLPAAANANAGYQLTCAGADTLTSWGAAGSLRELKDILGVFENPQDALDAILKATVYRFHYKEGKGTQDSKTEYVGIMSDEAPWAMHYAGGVVNPVNSLGFTVLGFQAMAQKIAQLEGKLAALGAA